MTRILSLFGVLFLVGCVHMPTANNTIVVPEAAQKADLLEIAIDVAKEMKLPSVSKLDKANGIVEFGGFDSPMMGTTAQVRIRSDKNLDVTVKRGSAYVPLPVDKTAAEFKAKLEERLANISK